MMVMCLVGPHCHTQRHHLSQPAHPWAAVTRPHKRPLAFVRRLVPLSMLHRGQQRHAGKPGHSHEHMQQSNGVWVL